MGDGVEKAVFSVNYLWNVPDYISMNILSQPKIKFQLHDIHNTLYVSVFQIGSTPI